MKWDLAFDCTPLKLDRREEGPELIIVCCNFDTTASKLSAFVWLSSDSKTLPTSVTAG